MDYNIYEGDCITYLQTELNEQQIALTFLDPPFNQDKDYALHNDALPDAEYWAWMHTVCKAIFERTTTGGALYFMQREKNAEAVLRCLRETGWTFQNLIVWKKKTSAVPGANRFGKHYQIIVYGTKGHKPRVFNKLRIDPPLLETEKYRRPQGMYVTDVWDDIRELTSGYFAGDEALRNDDGERFHKQQAPIALLLRIILSSTLPSDLVLDPFAGTGTTLVTAVQLGRRAMGIELDPHNVACIRHRLKQIRKADQVQRYYQDYRYTEKLEAIWGGYTPPKEDSDVFDLPLFRPSKPE